MTAAAQYHLNNNLSRFFIEKEGMSGTRVVVIQCQTDELFMKYAFCDVFIKDKNHSQRNSLICVSLLNLYTYLTCQNVEG